MSATGKLEDIAIIKEIHKETYIRKENTYFT